MSVNWIQTSTRLPEEDGLVIVYCSDYEENKMKVSCCWYEDTGSGPSFEDITGYVYYPSRVTHWRSLPEGPKE